MPIVKKYYKMYRAFPDPDYFYLENTYNGNNTFSVGRLGSISTTDLQYSLDKSTWTDCYSGVGNVTVPAGGKVYLRSTTGMSSDSGYIYVRMSQSHVAGGNIRTLNNYMDLTADTSSFNSRCLFYNDAALTSVEDLTFDGMTTVVGMSEMFSGCTNLTKGADISSITTKTGSYLCMYMYQGCSSLTLAYAPSVSNWVGAGNSGWLQGVAASGVVMKPSTLTIPTDSNSGVPTGWTTQDY